MAALQGPEIQFAQKLASNEKPIRTKALKKLRKYIGVRSQKAAGGFTSEELLKLWKGLFYCLWMQDKPLLQEELSNTISTLIHSFHDTNGQILFIESSLKTFKREWTGIDRLRMDKFFQLVRFMFRQSFEMLKNKEWESSVVAQFLDVFATELLIAGNDAPTGLQLHILDLYLTELAAVGSAELTADQNLQLIEPFFKTAAKTKDRTLFRAICINIFSTIIDQAPLAIEDLMRELNENVSSDSGQSSEGEEEENPVKKINGSKSSKKGRKLQSGESDKELPVDDDAIPVLQFDYKAVADKLFEVASQGNVPSLNRRRIYKITRVLLNLSEGIFPQVRRPEEVSSDEDDEFDSRKRKKRQLATSNRKKKMKLKGVSDSGKDDVKATDGIVKNTKKPKKKKKKARLDGNANVSDVVDTQVTNQNGLPGKAKKQTSVTASEEVSQPNSCITNNKSKKKKKKQAVDVKLEEVGNSKTCTTQEVNTIVETAECASTSETSVQLKSKVDKTGPQTTAEVTSNEPGTQALNSPKTNKKRRKAKKVELPPSSQQTQLDSPSVPCDTSADVATEFKPENITDATPLTKKSKKGKNKITLTSPSTTSESEPTFDHHVVTPLKKNKQKSAQVKEVCRLEEPKVCDEASSSSGKPNKRKRKIPVTFEYEADEHESSPAINETADTTSSVKKIKVTCGSSTPKAKPKLENTSSCDLVRFQRKAKVPTPLFFRANSGSCKTTFVGNEMGQTPTSDSKKVTFQLKSNKTAEFRKNDRSLLLSPEGPSKVPFDPKQKPKSGVLKSSPTPLFTRIKKTPTAGRKKGSRTPKSTPGRRPTAADFF
nr:ribosomal RNA processing protein 1 homolog A-like [Nerophis lumbriciformis]